MPRLLAPLLLALLPALAQAEELIRVYNWNDYIAPEVLEEFRNETGIKVEYHTFSSADDLDKSLASGEPIDVAVPSHNDLPRLIKEGRLQPLDFARLPNRQHLDKQLASKLAALDPNNQHAVPYLWGAVGLAVNTPQAEKAFGGPLPNSWSLLFDAQQSARLGQCGISLLDAPDETLAVLLNYQGRNLVRSAPSQLKRSAETLYGLRPHLRYVDGERYIADLNSGNLCVAMAWVGDALKAAAAGQPVTFMVPDEGSVVFIDNLVIPANANRADLAHKFIDFMLRPQVAAKITTATLYPSGNADARQYLNESLRDQPGLYPDKDTKRRLFPVEPVPDKLSATRDEVWTAFREGK